MSRTLDSIRHLISEGNVRISEHGYDELAADGLLARELVEGPCVLLLQRTNDGQPVHVVWGIPAGHNAPAVLVTAYLPDPEKWETGLTRRRK